MAMGAKMLSWVVIAVLLCGCQWKGGPQDSAGKAGNGEQPEPVIWRPEPVTMRVFPSTRFVKDGEQVALEARIELLDEMNDSIKWAGQFRLELYETGRASGPALGQRLYGWNADVITIEHQRQHYDPITRTYLFRLKLDDPAAPLHETVLRVAMTRPNGTRLETQAVLPATKLK